MPLPNISPDDEILTARDIAASMKVSVRYVQKLFELGLIRNFKRGRESVALKSFYHDHLRDLVAQEAERLEELAQ